MRLLNRKRINLQRFSKMGELFLFANAEIRT